MATTTNQMMFCWGNLADGQLGLGGIEDDQIYSPQEVVSLRGHRVMTMSCGVEHTLFVTNDGMAYSCGNNDHGQLGHERTRRKPEPIDSLATQLIRQVGCGYHHSIALSDKGQVYSWGDNSHGQLGHQTTEMEPCRAPKLVKQLTSYAVVQVACGYNHTLILTSESQIFSWGLNEFGQLGHSLDSRHVNSPRCVTVLTGLAIAYVAAGSNHSFCLTVSRALFGWGSNRYGQLGLGDAGDEVNQGPRLCRLMRSHQVKYVACGENHTAVLTEDGGVFTWGAGMFGQLGHNASSHEANPRKVFELMGSFVTMLACGRNHTVAYVESSRRLYAFGLGANGQLGLGSKQNRLVPTPVPFNFDTKSGGGHLVQFIASGGDQCFASVVSLKAGIRPYNFRFGIFSQEICTVTVDKLDHLCSISPTEKLSADLIRDIERLFASSSCINGSFLLPEEGHFDCSSKKPGVSVEAARAGFLRIRNISNQHVKALIEASLSRMLLSLPSSPPDFEALRLYLTLPCSPYFDSPLNENIICTFGKALISLNKNSGKVIDLWWCQLKPEELMRNIQTFKQLTILILNDAGPELIASSTKRQNLFICLEVLKKLKLVNDSCGHKVSYESFYIPGLHEKIDLRIDYFAWLRQTGQGMLGLELDLSGLPLPVTLQGTIWSYCHYPFIFDGQSKTLLLKVDAQLQMALAVGGAQARNFATLFLLPENPLLLLTVTRENIVRDTVNQLSKYNDVDFKKPLRVMFRGEEALDAGGVKKEFFLLLLRDLLDPKYGMFEYYEESKLLWFCQMTFETSQTYQLIGVICGLAIYNGIIIDMSLPLALFKKLLKKPVTLDDLKQLIPSVGRSLQSILDYEGDSLENDLNIAFEVTTKHFDVVEVVELEPGGSLKLVTQQNKVEYVEKYIEYIFTTSVSEQFEAFSVGFLKVCGGRVLELFQPEELQAMVAGNENYDWHELEENTEYKEGYTKDDPTIKRFWEVFHEFSLEDKKKFLLFLTGCDRIPILGMKAVKLIIQPVNVPTTFLPVAHTCFNVLDLPRYENKEVLRRNLLRAIEHTQGFGIA